MSKWLWVCDDLLSEEECEKMIEHFKGATSGEDRQRCGGVQPRDFEGRGIGGGGVFEDQKEDTEGIRSSRMQRSVQVLGVNETGGEFKMHRDGRNQDSLGRRSVITVNIFLNEDFTGGSTDFYLDDKQTLRESVKARRGRAAVFDAQQYHVGVKVEEGRKYLLRTDVMGEFGRE